MKKTFWLYYGKKLITGVRMPADATDDEIRQHALDNERIIPSFMGAENAIRFSRIERE